MAVNNTIHELEFDVKVWKKSLSPVPIESTVFELGVFELGVFQ